MISVTLDFVQGYDPGGQAAERLRQSWRPREVVADGKALEIPIADWFPAMWPPTARRPLPCDGPGLEAKDFFVNQALLTRTISGEKGSRELPRETEILSRQHCAVGTS